MKVVTIAEPKSYVQAASRCSYGSQNIENSASGVQETFREVRAIAVSSKKSQRSEKSSYDKEINRLKETIKN